MCVCVEIVIVVVVVVCMYSVWMWVHKWVGRRGMVMFMCLVWIEKKTKKRIYGIGKRECERQGG